MSLSMCKCWFVAVQRRRIRLYWDARPSANSTCHQKCTGWFYGGMWDCMSGWRDLCRIHIDGFRQRTFLWAHAIMGRCGRWYNRGHNIFCVQRWVLSRSTETKYHKILLIKTNSHFWNWDFLQYWKVCHVLYVHHFLPGMLSIKIKILKMTA